MVLLGMGKHQTRRGLLGFILPDLCYDARHHTSSKAFAATLLRRRRGAMRSRRYNAQAAEALIRRHQQDTGAAGACGGPKGPGGMPAPGVRRTRTADAQTATGGELTGEDSEARPAATDSSFHGHILDHVQAMLNHARGQDLDAPPRCEPCTSHALIHAPGLHAAGMPCP